MLAEHVDRTCNWNFDHADVAGTARLVGLDENRENEWNLDIPRYTEPDIEEEPVTVAETIENLKTGMYAAGEAEGKIRVLLAENGLIVTEKVFSHRGHRGHRGSSWVMN